MASAFLANTDYASPITEKILMIGSWFCILFLLNACGYANLSVKHLNFDKRKAKSNQLAVLSLDYDEDEFTPPYEVEFVRTRSTSKGYAIRAPLYQKEEGAVHFAIAKQKETKWFFGIQGRWEF